MTGGPPGQANPRLSVTVERFDRSRHETGRFTSGQLSLDDYIQATVDRDMADRTAIAYVLVNRADTAPVRRVIGYFTLSGLGFSKRQARRRDRDRHLGAYDPIPAVLIGRLALDSEYQGLGLGKALLVAALNAILDLSNWVGVAVAIVHALDENAAAFYEHLGFTRFRDQPDHLYYPLASYARGLNTDR